MNILTFTVFIKQCQLQQNYIIILCDFLEATNDLLVTHCKKNASLNDFFSGDTRLSEGCIWRQNGFANIPMKSCYFEGKLIKIETFIDSSVCINRQDKLFQCGDVSCVSDYKQPCLHADDIYVMLYLKYAAPCQPISQPSHHQPCRTNACSLNRRRSIEI